MLLRDIVTFIISVTFALAVVITVLVCIDFANTLQIVNHGARVPIVDSRCSNEPLNTCKYGLRSTASSGSSTVYHCETGQRMVGESCSSACFTDVDAGALTCDATATCVTDTPSRCLGYCNLTDVSSGPLGFVAGHADCVGKLTFKPYYYWNSTGSAYQNVAWLFFDVCTWYATAITVIMNPATSTGDYVVFPTVANFANDDPTYFLNLSNTECIQSTVHKVDTNFSTTIYRGLGMSNSGTYQAQATLITYQYKCAQFNEDLMEDPDFTQKRALDQRGFDPKVKLSSMLTGERNVAALRNLIANPSRPHTR
jgi:hypothetical protein